MRILLIEDDKNLCESLQFQLEKEGFTTDISYDGEEGLFLVQEQIYDLVLLDRMLPSMSGLEVLQQMRQEKIVTPVIFLTALGTLDDKVNGLENGADDYIVKPFAFRELLARIHSVIRRPGDRKDNRLLSLGNVAYDPVQKRLSNGEQRCTLSRREGDLLEIFLLHPGQTLPRNTLLLRVWGPDTDVEDGNLDNYIHFLRRRLKAVKSNLCLKTIRGVGYRLECP